MKKTLFVVLTALVMSLAFSACGSSSPEEQMMGYMENLSSLLKETHIKSGSDVRTFAEKARKIQDKADALKQKYGKDYESDLSEEEEQKLQSRMEALMNQMIPEMKRIQEEAASANLTEAEMKELREAIR